MKVLFVCTGNICRSPMAEAMLRHELSRRGCDSVEVASAGTWAFEGNAASHGAGWALRDLGIELGAHRSRAIVADEVNEADLVIAMTAVHLGEIEQIAPEAVGKTFLIKELAEMEARGDDPRERLAALLKASRPEPRRALDVDDPYGLMASAYKRVVGDLEPGIAFLADVLCPDGESVRPFPESRSSGD